MFDPITMIILTLKNFIQRFRNVFSFVFDNYFPQDEKEDGFIFLKMPWLSFQKKIKKVLKKPLTNKKFFGIVYESLRQWRQDVGA